VSSPRVPPGRLDGIALAAATLGCAAFAAAAGALHGWSALEEAGGGGLGTVAGFYQWGSLLLAVAPIAGLLLVVVASWRPLPPGKMALAVSPWPAFGALVAATVATLAHLLVWPVVRQVLDPARDSSLDLATVATWVHRLHWVAVWLAFAAVAAVALLFRSRGAWVRGALPRRVWFGVVIGLAVLALAGGLAWFVQHPLALRGDPEWLR